MQNPVLFIAAMLFTSACFGEDVVVFPDSGMVIVSDTVYLRIPGEAPDSESTLPDPDAGYGYVYDVPPRLRFGVAIHPHYPDSAKNAGIGGRAYVLAYIDRHGWVRKTRTLREDPESWGFGAAAQRAINDWKYSPAMQQGKPKGLWIIISVTFDPKKP